MRPNGIQTQATPSLFQFTHPGGVRLAKDYFTGVVPSVSIHAPGRGATATRSNTLLLVVVSIHAPGRGATYGCFAPRKVFNVSIHAPGRGATWSVLSVPSKRTEFQFTHPGGVRRRLTFYASHGHPVSIHAPGRGATRALISAYSTVVAFQFTHPGGVRRQPYKRYCLHQVSIHAPGRGATSFAS